MLGRAFRLTALWGLLLFLFAAPVASLAQDNSVSGFQSALELDRKALAEIVSGLKDVNSQGAAAGQALQALKESLDKARTDLASLQLSIASAQKTAKANLDKAGPKPKPTDPPESADSSAERDKAQADNQKLSDLATEARRLVVQSDGVAKTLAIAPYLNTLAQTRKQIASIAARLADVKDDDPNANQALQSLKDGVNRVRADSVTVQSSVLPLRDAAKAGLEKFGPRPGPSDSPESEEIAAERQSAQALYDQLAAIAAEAQARIKQSDTLVNAVVVRPFQAINASAKKTLDDVDSDLTSNADDKTLDQLLDMRTEINKVRGDLVTLLATVTPLRDQSKAQLDKLPPAPKPTDPPESPDIAATRDKETVLSQLLSEIVTNAQIQSGRADDLNNSIIEHQRELLTGRLFRGGSTVFSKDFWKPTVESLPDAFSRASATARTSLSYFTQRANSTSLAIFLMTIAGGYVIAQFLRFRIMRWRSHLPRKKKASRRYVASLDAVLGVVHTMLSLPCAIVVGVLAFRFSNLLPRDVIDDFGWDFIRAGVVGGGLWAIARAILAKENAELRLLPLSDWAVRRIGRRMSWLALVLAGSLLLDGFIRSLHANLQLTEARAGITAILLIIITASLLMRLRHAPPTVFEGRQLSPDEDINALDILRPLSWLAVAIMVVCLAFGYNALAVATAVLPILLISVVAASYLLNTLVDSALTDNLLSDPDRRRAIAGAIGISTKKVAFVTTLLSGILRFLIVVFAILTLGTPFGFYSGDMLPALQRAYFGFQIGGMTISPSSILGAMILFALIWGLMRLVRGWLLNTLLPRTSFDSGLQNSIATIIGYLGVILAITAALSEIGINLQNIAYVASALALGIGFGVSAIVNNFVSGLILLAERPIRVGDIIAAGGEEGYVRRISVRATEIETFERATLIIPNSKLISDPVKNWVYGNTWSRLRIVLTLAYDSDVEAVKAAMVAGAGDDPRILPSPPPRVYLSKIDAGLEFELVMMIASMETMAAVKSDVLTRIVKAFRAKGIRLLAQGAAVAAPVVVQFDPAMQDALIAKLLKEAEAALPPAADPPSAPVQAASPPAAN